MEKGWNIQTMSNFDYIEMVNEIWPFWNGDYCHFRR